MEFIFLFSRYGASRKKLLKPSGIIPLVFINCQLLSGATTNFIRVFHSWKKNVTEMHETLKTKHVRSTTNNRTTVKVEVEG